MSKVVTAPYMPVIMTIGTIALDGAASIASTNVMLPNACAMPIHRALQMPGTGSRGSGMNFWYNSTSRYSGMEEERVAARDRPTDNGPTDAGVRATDDGVRIRPRTPGLPMPM